jgi:glucose-6-phosphate 1-dehydrogenase
VEKPFGYNLESALELKRIYASAFEERQVYRIDHFLGKETAQNILAFRFANGIFEPLWNRNYIDYVEVTAVENLGIENRGGFYDTAGALRDMVQNHLIQLVALTAMEPPSVFNADYFRNEVVKVYNALRPLNEVDFDEHIVRGQYLASGDKKGYREEKGIAPDSRTETFVAMKLRIDNWRWSGVPFYIRTGKQMPTKVTEIVVHFKEAPHQMFSGVDGAHPKPNKLILRIQPNEGIVLKIGMKDPGQDRRETGDYGLQLRRVGRRAHRRRLRPPHRRLHTGRRHALQPQRCSGSLVEVFRPYLALLAEPRRRPTLRLSRRHLGPLESESLMTDHGVEWTNPCKNLTNTDLYCEL